MDSEENNLTIVHCDHCNTPLNVTGFSPYTLVECTDCKNFTRTSSRLGSYNITSRLGVGGMSLVFRAEDETLGREVALKVLNQTYSSQPERIEKFEHEAKVMALVSHPNVVKIYSVGKSNGLFYIAMELVDGNNLEAKIAEKQGVPEREALTIAIELAEGLRAGYEAGVLHRDMKPANVLFNKKGEAQIVDFGLALLSGDQSEEEEIWATPQYAPPEVLERKPEDFRSDIYSLGATLYHVFSGKPPIVSDTQSIAELLELKKTIPPLGEKVPSLSAETCRIVDRAMSYDPVDRFSSYEELIEVLKNAAGLMDRGESLSWMHVKRLQKRDQLKKILYVSGGGVLVLIGGLIFIFSSEKKDDEEITQGTGGEGGVAIVNTNPSAEEQRMAAQRKAGEEYVAARKLFFEKQYRVAAVMYEKVVRTPDVYPLTGAWAALEGYASYILSGEEESGLKLLQMANSRNSQGDSSDANEIKLRKLIASLVEPALIKEDFCREYMESFPPVYFIAALKAWTQGELTLASELLDKARKDASDQEWNKQSLSIAENGIQDLKLLIPVENLPEDDSFELGLKIKYLENLSLTGNYSQVYREKRVGKLNRSLEQMRVGESRIMQGGEALRTEKEWKEGFALLQRKEFARAELYFLSIAESKTPENRDLYFLLAELSGEASQFLNYIGAIITASGNEHHVEGVEGEPVIIKKIKAGNPVVEVNGKDKSVKWSQISSKSLLQIYKQNTHMMKNVPKEAKIEIVYNSFVYAFLSNERQQAALIKGELSKLEQEIVEQWKGKREKLLSFGL